ncbi:MAG: fasciclin domain-containing protein [Promethearchaeota archaeon]|nr:MAG: fasciclin domain-containing protein [Candidatus Lokiarchaeota archaeon]
MPNIVEVAKQAGGFSTLLKAAEVAGLVDTLSSGGPFTIFAPTDDAFSKIPSETLNSLLKEPEKLKGILLYHGIEGKVKSTDLSGTLKVKTLHGQEIMIDATKGVKVNDANVVKADIETDNGIIHVIDKVILPS